MKRVSPSAERNKAPIADVLKDHLPETGLVLEIASGTGQHSAYFSELFPHLTWQPSDCEDLASIQNYAEERENMKAPLTLDVLNPWPIENADFVFNCNMIHISPPETVPALFQGTSTVLPSGGKMLLYGPFRFQDREIEESNLKFEQMLQGKDPRFGIRVFEEVVETAQSFGMQYQTAIRMPANNHALIFQKAT